jgi:hypothetical protein
MASKTIKVELLVNKLNETLRTYVEKSTNSDGLEGQRVFLENILMASGNYKGFFYLTEDEVPEGQRVFLENILMASGNYKGFFYLTEDEVPEGERPGIRNESTANRFIDTDCNRVRYI